VPESRHRYQVDAAKGLAELADAIRGQTGGGVRVLRGFDPHVETLIPGNRGDVEFATLLSEMRLIKDDLEVRALKRAIASTRLAFEDVMRQLPKLRSEREIEGIFNLRARVEGNDVGYGTIAATGANATILHWTRNDGRVKRGDLMLLDAGVEGNELYTADVTRTVPISGKFTRPQKEIYELVHNASSTSGTRCTARATCWGSTCTIALRRGPRTTSTAHCRPGWC